MGGEIDSPPFSLSSYHSISFMPENQSIFNKLLAFLLSLGPAFLAIGYTIGTGSVTSMVVAGNKFGMDLLWVLLLSCFFSWILMEAYGRYTLVTNETALFGIKKHIRFGTPIAILIIIGISIGQWNSLIGILGISANAIYEVFARYFPLLAKYPYQTILVIGIIVLSTMYLVLLQGKYSSLEKVLIFFVSLMGISFLISLFFVSPDAGSIAKGLVPKIPDVAGGKMLVAAFVGTTMAAATFLSRSLFIKGKGWTLANLKDQSNDAKIAAILIFLISGSIMAISASALAGKGMTITKVFDMVNTLEPLLGKFAVTIFLFGILGAGLSSVFPILLITPILIADFQSGELDLKSKQFRIITGVACLVGLTVPIFGANPINAQILSQVFNVFVLPLVVLSIILLLNKKGLMGEYKASTFLNVGMGLAFVFSCIISYTGVVAIFDSLKM